MTFFKDLLIRMHRRAGDRSGSMDVLYLTTVGAKSGQKRVSPVARFADGDNAWLIVASNGGKSRHPAWYHNLRAHPDQVTIEFGGATRPVTVADLHGGERDAAWERVIAAQPRFRRYLRRTSRSIPIIRLTAPPA